jgi:hypothetical protein
MTCDKDIDYEATKKLTYHEPLTFDEATKGDERVEWLKAINEEMQSHAYNGTWELVHKPPNATTIQTKWVFKRKRDVNGRLVRYKARLVAKGYTQKQGKDYDETFAPVIRPT